MEATTIATRPASPETPGARVPTATWVILAFAAFLVLVVNFAGGGSESRECEREARDNAAVLAAVGGEARYVAMCMDAQARVRQLQAIRKP